MQVTRTDKSPTEVTLKVSAGAAELESIKNHVLRTHFADTRVPGFRAGRAPLEMIEKHVNQQHFNDEFMEHAINDLYRKAVESEKLRPVGTPRIELKKFVPYTTLEFETTQEVIGPVTLPNYKAMKLAKPKVSVTAADVADVVKNLQARLAERKPVDRPAKSGDEVMIDFAGKDEKGEPVAGADAKGYPLTLGSNAFIPGFEDNLVGLKRGDKKEFSLTFPKDYQVAALQNRKITFDVTVNAVNELVEPKADDEFAKKAGPFKTLAELKEDIKRQLKIEREAQAQRDYENQLISQIADKTKVQIPKGLVDEQILRLEQDERQNLTYRGQTWQEHLKEEGVTEEEHRERQRPNAEMRVKGGLVLSEIAQKEGLEVSEDELNQRIAELKQQYSDPTMRAELDKPENRQDLAARVLTEKTIAKLVDYAS